VNVGYARTSTVDQVAGFEAQLRDLKAAKCKKVFSEQVSSVTERDQLKAAIDYLREGDVLVSTKLDRIARSVRHLLQIVDEVEAKGAKARKPKVLDAKAQAEAEFRRVANGGNVLGFPKR
jgi:DNA invertase Pin-like site-specific DNA recombinase